jgi:hypothetical protein
MHLRTSARPRAIFMAVSALSVLVVLGASLAGPGAGTSSALAAAPPKPTVTVTVTQTVTVTVTVTASPPPACTPSGPIDINGGSNVLIENKCFTDIPGLAIRLTNVTGTITIRNNQFIRVGDGIIIKDTVPTSHGAITVEGNYYEDLHPFSADPPTWSGGYIHALAVNGLGAEANIIVRDNTMDGAGWYGDAGVTGGDFINFYETGGTAASPVLITRNRIRACRPGGLCSTNPQIDAGIILGDQRSGTYDNDYIIARENLLINPPRVGIGIAGGHDSTIDRNIIYGAPSQAAYVWDWQSAGGCFGHTVTGNRSNGGPGFWNGGNCGTITMTDNIWNDPNVTASLWGQSWDQLLLLLP